MEAEYRISSVEDPEQIPWGVIGGGLNQFNRRQAGDNQFQRLCFTMTASDGEVVGGVIGETYWDWFYLDLIWVAEDLRGCGYGRSLMEIAEREAQLRGAKNVYLDTFSFQAPDFYKKQGYTIFGELPDFPPGHQRYFMRKELK